MRPLILLLGLTIVLPACDGSKSGDKGEDVASGGSGGESNGGDAGQAGGGSGGESNGGSGGQSNGGSGGQSNGGSGGQSTGGNGGESMGGSGGQSTPEGDYYRVCVESETRGTTKLNGLYVDTNWDPDGGFIFLNTDGCSEGPIGTITLYVGSPFDDENGTWMAIYGATVSTTDVRVGNALELNAVLWETMDPGADNPAPGAVFVTGMGSDWIEGTFTVEVASVPPLPDDPVDKGTVSGAFRAFSGPGGGPSNGGALSESECAALGGTPALASCDPVDLVGG